MKNTKNFLLILLAFTSATFNLKKAVAAENARTVVLQFSPEKNLPTEERVQAFRAAGLNSQEIGAMIQNLYVKNAFKTLIALNGISYELSSSLELGGTLIVKTNDEAVAALQDTNSKIYVLQLRPLGFQLDEARVAALRKAGLTGSEIISLVDASYVKSTFDALIALNGIPHELITAPGIGGTLTIRTTSEGAKALQSLESSVLSVRENALTSGPIGGVSVHN